MAEGRKKETKLGHFFFGGEAGSPITQADQTKDVVENSPELWDPLLPLFRALEPQEPPHQTYIWMLLLLQVRGFHNPNTWGSEPKGLPPAHNIWRICLKPSNPHQVAHNCF